MSEHLRLLCLGLRNYRAVRVLVLSSVHYQKHLQWASEHLNWTIGKWKDVNWCDKSCFFAHHVDSQVCALCLPGDVTRMHHGGKKANGGSVMLRAVFCWESLGHGIHMDAILTCTTCLNIIADQAHLNSTTGLFQQTVCPVTLQKWLGNGWMNLLEFKVLT